MSTVEPLTHHRLPVGAPARRCMVPRSPHEAHRTSTPLELLFDLVFVVAIAEAGQALHHALAAGHVGEGLAGYLMVFFAIWWAWMNFTWFASAYDCDDVPYRLAVFVQIAGALVMAAGIAAMFESKTPNLTVITGYMLMRFAMVAQWLRAAAADPSHRATALRFALGITVVQCAWVATLLIPRLWVPAFLILTFCEVTIPVWAERTAPTTWHPHHIAERYGLLTLIVLGESILAATMAIQAAVVSGTGLSTLAPLIAGGLLIVFSMWWVYFDRPVHDLLTGVRKAIVWGYGHYVIFGAAAAVGAGLAAAADQATHHGTLSAATAGAAVAVPVAIYVLCLWVLHYRPEYRQTWLLGPIAAVLVLLTPLTNQAVLFTGLIMVMLIVVKHAMGARNPTG